MTAVSLAVLGTRGCRGRPPPCRLPLARTPGVLSFAGSVPARHGTPARRLVSLLLFGAVVPTAPPNIWCVEAIKAKLQSGLPPGLRSARLPPREAPAGPHVAKAPSALPRGGCFFRLVFHIGRQNPEALWCKDEAYLQLLLAEETLASPRPGAAVDLGPPRGLCPRWGQSHAGGPGSSGGEAVQRASPSLSVPEVATRRGVGTLHGPSRQLVCHPATPTATLQPRGPFTSCGCAGVAAPQSLGPEVNRLLFSQIVAKYSENGRSLVLSLSALTSGAALRGCESVERRDSVYTTSASM